MLEQLGARFAGSLGASLGQGLTGGGGPFMGGDARSGAYGTTLDGANWSVNFGGSQVVRADAARSGTPGPDLAPQQAGLGMLGPLLLMAAAGVYLWRRRRGR